MITNSGMFTLELNQPMSSKIKRALKNLSYELSESIDFQRTFDRKK